MAFSLFKNVTGDFSVNLSAYILKKINRVNDEGFKRGEHAPSQTAAVMTEASDSISWEFT